MQIVTTQVSLHNHAGWMSYCPQRAVENDKTVFRFFLDAQVDLDFAKMYFLSLKPNSWKTYILV